MGLLFNVSAMAAPGLDNASPIGSFLDGVFPDASPGASNDSTWVQADYYPDLSFVEPIRIIEHPIQDRLLIIGKDGVGWTVSHQPGATDRTQFFDIRPIMHGKSGVGEGGISDLAFHPEFGQPGSPNANFVYITYRWSPTQSGTFTQSPTVDGYDRLSRFSVVGGVVDLSTEQILMNQFDRQQWHVGGDMFFGDDGYLYISRGDEGNCCDRTFNTQRLDGGLWSGILRIDVDQDPTRSHPIRRQPTHLQEDPTNIGPQWPPSFTQNYGIPNDNPFVDEDGENLEEFFSLGLRHPFTISYDDASGNIWIADVGQSSREEISIARRGDNHQWGYREGNVAGVIPEPANVIGTPAPPVWDYPRSQGQAVIGAGVYRGDLFPELVGKYIFSDFVSGRLWTATGNGGTYDIDQIGEVTAGFPNGINGYLLDSKGNILMARTAGGLDPNGRIQMLVRANSVPVAPEPPELLSLTGAFQDLQTLTPNPSCIPYDLNEPFWSDGAAKFRWMCIPNDGTHDTTAEQIEFSAEGDWTFPTGAVLIKHFELAVDESDPNNRTRLETRFVVKTESGHYAVTYRWNDSQTDAVLLTQGEERVVSVQTPTGPRDQVWVFPSRNECLACHSSTAGAVLGANTRQLNGEITYPLTGRSGNQLETLHDLGILSLGVSNAAIPGFLASVTTSVAKDDSNASLSDRARSYLDSNCAYCHRPGGVRANFDARLTTPLSQQNLIGGELAESFGIAGEAVIVPGSLSQSVLFHRANSVGESFSMPPIAKNLIDTQGIAVVEQWINQLGGFELGNDTSTGGSFIDGHHPSLYINEQDTYQQGSEAGALRINEFKFFAQRLGNPVTPVVVRVNGNNDFTVLAIGTTRTQSEYVIGSNSFDFDGNGTVTLSLTAGETIAIGFMDSFPDGSGWGAGTVIPATAGSGANQDEIWGYLPSPLISQGNGFVAGRDTAAIAVNQNPLQTNAGKALGQFNLRRDYKVAITFGSDAIASGPAPEVVNGSFELPGVSNFTIYTDPGDIPGWNITSGSVEIDRLPWPAAVGLQSMDLAGSSPGSIEQSISGFNPGATYALTWQFAAHGTATAQLSADVLIDGSVVQTIQVGPTVRPPNCQSGRVEFVAGQSGTATIGFAAQTAGSRGVVLDNVGIELVAAAPGGGDNGGGDNGDPDNGGGDNGGGDNGGDGADPDPDPQPGDNGVVVGSTITNRPALDGWNSNIVINETDTYTNTSGGTLELDLANFSFFAGATAAPITPFVVQVNGDNDFTVLAVGTTRTGYALGENSFAFSAAPDRLSLSAGTTIAVGFLDANADGSGSGAGSVVRYQSGVGEIWYSGGPAGADSASVSVGSAPTPGARTLLDLSRRYSFSIAFTPVAEAGEAVTLGQEVIDRANLDGWNSNLVINESGLYLNDTGSAVSVNLDSFNFYAGANTAPITPFVVQVNGDNNFTVLAIGSTRSGFALGLNTFAFDDAAASVSLPAGARLAIGFLDANPDGSGSVRSVVDFTTEPGNSIWYSGGPAASQSASVTVGAAPTPGARTLLGLSRSYSFSIGFTVGTAASDPSPQPEPEPEPQPDPDTGSALLINGSFEDIEVLDNGFVQVNSLAGWTVTGLAEVWTSGFLEQDASLGQRFLELDARGQTDGISQTVATETGRQYRLTFDAKLRNGTLEATNTIEVRIGGTTVLTFTPRSADWESVSLLFTGTGSDEIGFFETADANNGSGSHLDNVRIDEAILPIQTQDSVSLCSSGNPNRLVNGSFEESSHPQYSSTEALIIALGRNGSSGRFLDRHTDADFPGWFTTGGIALQQGGLSEGGTIEVGIDGFLGVNSVEGRVFVEMDANHHHQIVAVTPGERLDWELSHRGRPGTDSVRVAIGPMVDQDDLAIVFTPNQFWVTHHGSYTVPAGVSQIVFTVSPHTAANGDIDSSNLLDDVKLCAAN